VGRSSENPVHHYGALPETSLRPGFIDGLHDPSKRPTADEWESALVKTVDLIQPCQNKDCDQKWYVFNGKTKPVCPYCGTPYKGKLPILNLYSSRKAGTFRPDDHRLMVWSGQSLYAWHVNRLIAPNERTSDEQKKRVGYFVFHNDQWWLVNEGSLAGSYHFPIGKRSALVKSCCWRTTPSSSFLQRMVGGW
jgi:hypothetical protein